MKKTILSFLTSQMILSGMLFMVTTVTAQNISGIINDYTPVTAIISCGVSVGSATAFSVGDTVLLIQMKGASIDTSNSLLSVIRLLSFIISFVPIHHLMLYNSSESQYTTMQPLPALLLVKLLMEALEGYWCLLIMEPPLLMQILT